MWLCFCKFFFPSCCLSGRKTTTAAFARGGKSENIRLNQMQIERFAVGNFQFSSPYVCVLVYVCSVFDSQSRLDSIPEKQTWNWFSVAAFRFVSFRSLGRHLLSVSVSLSVSEWHGTGGGKSGWLLLGLLRLLLPGRIHTLIRSQMYVCVCAFNYFLPWRSLLIITRWQLLRTKFSLSSQAGRTITKRITQISFSFYSLLKQTNFWAI